MKTPICDYVCRYAQQNPIRFHMPGHKGRHTRDENTAFSGLCSLDITEIDGADVLYASEGIIRESEENAAELYGSARTVYSTEGSSLCIRAMLYLSMLHARCERRIPRIAAGRNAHRSFVEASAVLDLGVSWFGTGENLLCAEAGTEELETLFRCGETAPTAVYVTSPDYLGTCVDLRPISELCHRNGALLLVDNAHGAYLKFLRESRHPLDNGVDLCCDSAHKTLPVLTGGAYLHASECCPETLLPMMERAMALFASTSPSWLTLQSLDAVNAKLAEEYTEKIRKTADQLDQIKKELHGAGWMLTGDEPLKLTLCPKSRGYTGTELAACLKGRGMVCEFADPDYLVIMVTPENTEAELKRLKICLSELPVRTPVTSKAPKPGHCVPVLRPREALFRSFENIPVEQSIGRILASPSVSCPPAVPILICGERIDDNALEMFRYYGIETCDVVKESICIE